MRLHTLTLHAVGPFADVQVIDFDRLGSGGLFLFEGPTGVGKSTILDALTFALYGGLASDGSDPSRMRSDFADPMVSPEVVLEFSVRGQRHRITRSPEHQRPKKRGTGFTTERTRVHLERCGGAGWTSLSHSKEEAGTLVTDLVGLSRDQFRQVVLLPQGEFATFLRADDDRRREVLMKLFGAQFFLRVTDHLQARAQAARTALAEVDTDLTARIAAAWEAAGLAPDDALAAGEATFDQRVAQVAELAGGIGAVADEAAAAAADRDERVRVAQAHEESAADLLDRVDRRIALLRRLDQLESGRAAQEERLQRLAAARAAAPSGPLLALLEEAETSLSGAHAARDALPVSTDLPGDAMPDELTTMAEQLRAAAAGLGHVADAERGLPQRRAEAGDAAQRVTTLEAELALAADQSRALPEQLRLSRESLAAAQALMGRRDALAQRHSALTERLAAANRADELAAQVGRARKARREASRSHEHARDTVALLTEHRLDDLRGELAGQLVSGDPCLVCGSCEHPAPASVRTVGVSDQQVRDAVALRDQRHLELEAAELALARAEGEAQAAVAALGGAGAQELSAELQGVRQEQGAVDRAEEAAARHAAQVERLEGESAHVTAALVELTGNLAAARTAADRLAEDLARTEHEVTAATEGHATVHARVEAMQARAGRAVQMAGALVRIAGARAERDRLAQRAHEEARAAGFDDATQARLAMLTPVALAALVDEVESWAAELDRLRGQAQAPDLLAVADRERADVDRAAQAAAEAVQSRVREAAVARREATIAAQRRDRFAERFAEVRQAHAQRGEMAARNDEVIALDQYARGMAGSPRMTLVTFVLRYWFEQVVAAANVRLAQMSAGKYQLVRVDESSRRSARVGLGLAVLDRHTGKERSPASLSGGETFYTSLSLALGLTDVVVAQAGGAQLDTLFIDEGFGSLDPDTLDDVMAVIDDLRGNGRVVGIVSHVPDLKERISERLSVRRVRPDGPSQIRVLA